MTRITASAPGEAVIPEHDLRLQHLHTWLDARLPELSDRQGWGKVPEATLSPAGSDASFRRYFRWQSEARSLIVMDNPPTHSSCLPFVRIARLLAGAGLNVPEILAQDLEQGFLLLTDLGQQTYLDVITEDNADALFQDAIDALLMLQRLPPDTELPAYDAALLQKELQLFPDWYLRHHLGIELDEQDQAVWEQICRLLTDSALNQPQVVVHRDYMPRNLMLNRRNPGILDFQDAVHGPISYDITCLFKDAFLSWPEQRVQSWLKHYWQQAREQGIGVQDDWQDFLRASDLISVQRHLKVIGIFARIRYRDGKPRYLNDAPRFFAYIRAVLARRPELAELGTLLAKLPEAQVPAS